MLAFIQEYLGVGLSALLSSFTTWLFTRQREKINNNALQIENAQKLLSYYEELIEKLGDRALKSEERASEYEAKLSTAIEELNHAKTELEKARKTIEDLEKTIESLTNELKKYKQLNGKSK